jgi:hypothetical protein
MRDLTAEGLSKKTSVMASSVKKLVGTKLYKDKDLVNMMTTHNSDITVGQRLNIKDRVLGDLQDGRFARVEFFCVGQRQIMFGELIISILVKELKIGEIQHETNFE